MIKHGLHDCCECMVNSAQQHFWACVLKPMQLHYSPSVWWILHSQIIDPLCGKACAVTSLCLCLAKPAQSHCWVSILGNQHPGCYYKDCYCCIYKILSSFLHSLLLYLLMILFWCIVLFYRGSWARYTALCPHRNLQTDRYFSESLQPIE